MINPKNVVRILGQYVSKLPRSIGNPSGDSFRDEDVAKQLLENLISIMNCTEYRFEIQDTLDYTFDVNQLAEIEEDSSDEEEEDDAQDTDYNNNEIDHNFLHQFSLEYMKKVVFYYDEISSRTGKRKHSWRALQHTFKSVKSRNYIDRFRKYIAAGGTKQHKLQEIDSYVFGCFEKARTQLLSVHEIDLKHWALKKAREIDDITFTASDFWLHQFKRRHHICGRKITKLVTKSHVENEADIQQSADRFVLQVQKVLTKYSADCVFNTDQSGLQLELFSGRTLSFEGEHLTLGKVQSINCTTHSYTVQPMISISGRQIGPLFLCLKEASGHLSDNIKRALFTPANIVITCSKSGKLTTSLVRYWIENVLKPTIGTQRSLLLSDYWGGQRDQQLYADLKELTRLEIPKKTTAMIQPCDVYYNRQYKYLVRKMYHHVRLYDLDIRLSQRNNIIKLNSLVYNQLSSPKFYSMIKYAWYQSGYLLRSPGVFQNVQEICFSFQIHNCQLQGCVDPTPFIKCAYCDKVLCLEHFFESYHFH